MNQTEGEDKNENVCDITGTTSWTLSLYSSDFIHKYEAKLSGNILDICNIFLNSSLISEAIFKNIQSSLTCKVLTVLKADKIMYKKK